MAATGFTLYGNVRVNVPNLVLIFGSFQQASGVDPDILYGHGFSVARTAAGKYTVTIPRALKILALLPGIGETADNVDPTVHFEELTLGTGQTTFVIHSKVSTTDTEVEDRQISFCVAAIDTSIVSTRSS